MADPERTTPAAKKAAIAAAIVAAVSIATPMAEQFEGWNHGEAYYDPAHILTQCFGETRDVDPSRIYSKEQCTTKLRKRMARDYAPKIIACIPSFVDHHQAFGALLDAAYNAGPAAVCHSPMARDFNAGNYSRGCRDLLGWFVSARNRRTGVRVTYPGLVTRRKLESSVCAKGN